MLTPEDGTNVAGADSYEDLDGLETILVNYGYGAYVDATDQLTQEAHARLAVLYLDTAFQWKGRRTNVGQPLAWPRTGVLDQDGVLIAPNVIPSEVIIAEALLMAEQLSGSLTGSSGGVSSSDRTIIKESADDAMVEYERGSSDRHFPMVFAILRHLTTTALLGGFRQIMAQRG